VCSLGGGHNKHGTGSRCTLLRQCRPPSPRRRWRCDRSSYKRNLFSRIQDSQMHYLTGPEITVINLRIRAAAACCCGSSSSLLLIQSIQRRSEACRICVVLSLLRLSAFEPVDRSWMVPRVSLRRGVLAMAGLRKREVASGASDKTTRKTRV